MKNLFFLLAILVESICYSQLPTWTHSDGKGIFAQTDKQNSKKLNIWQEGNGQFNYEEISRKQNSNGEIEVILNDINGRTGMQVKISNNSCYWKYEKDLNWNMLYSGSWLVRPTFQQLASWNNGHFKEMDKKSGNNLIMWNEGNGQYNFEEISRTHNTSGDVEVILNDLNGRTGMQVRLTKDASYWKYQKDSNWMLMSNGSWSTIPSKITESANTTLKKSENGLPIYGIGDVSYNDNGVCIVLATKQKVTGIVDGGGYPKILTPYKDGLIDGIERRWYGSDEKSQLLYEKNYVNGKLIGWQRYYSESGKLLGECNLINGNGKIQVKYENGNLNWEENYLNGMLDGSTKSWLDNGKLIQEWQYKNGLLEGIAKSWFENGKLASESNYVKGELIKEQYWHPNGKRAYESNYKNGIMLDARSWYENGKRASEIFYKDGLIISEKCWEENGKKTFCDYNIGG